VTEKVYPFPIEGQAYLQEKYGIKPYSKRHLKRRIKLGLFPAPVYLSATRPVNTEEQLDRCGREAIKRALENS
jgi:hypothetical protein